MAGPLSRFHCVRSCGGSCPSFFFPVVWCREGSLVLSNDQNCPEALNKQTNKQNTPLHLTHPTQPHSTEFETAGQKIHIQRARDNVWINKGSHNCGSEFRYSEPKVAWQNSRIPFFSSLTCKMEIRSIYLAPWSIARNKSEPHVDIIGCAGHRCSRREGYPVDVHHRMCRGTEVVRGRAYPHGCASSEERGTGWLEGGLSTFLFTHEVLL